MAIELNGTTGITTPDLTSEAGLTVDGVSFASGAPANTLVTTSGGNVGIGTSSPVSALDVVNTATIKRAVSGNLDLNFYNAATANQGVIAKIRCDGEGVSNEWGALSFWTGQLTGSGATERARIDSSGNLLVGTTSTPNGTADGVQINPVDGANRFSRGSTSARYQITFYNPNGLVGRIETSGSSTSYVTSSDYRLKENVVGVTGASARVQQLNPVRFNFITDPDTTVDGFLAHEVQDVVPEAITGTKDATEMVDVHDEDGNVTGQEERPVYQGIDQSKLVPLLTAALQEALTKIETLEARVAALEAA